MVCNNCKALWLLWLNKVPVVLFLGSGLIQILPLAFGSFFLQWSTADEVNVDRFEIQRSGDGKDYNTIRFVKGGISKYSYGNAAPLKLINYYRLKTIDKDVFFEYSTAIIVCAILLFIKMVLLNE